MYYLQSRYYDPIVCRFINADVPDVITASPTALTDKNLFAYCDNNPVMRVDENGEFWGPTLAIMAVGGLLGAIINTAASVATQLIFDHKVDVESTAVAAISGFVSGAVAASPLGAIGQRIVGGVIEGLSYMADAYLNEEEISASGLVFAVGLGMVSNGGDGANYKDKLSIAITGAKNAKVFSWLTCSPKEAAHQIGMAVAKRKGIIRNAVGGFTKGTISSNVLNKAFGKAEALIKRYLE
jgi:RHS repeat-associated protein